jgi:hypothetical protein
MDDVRRSEDLSPTEYYYRRELEVRELLPAVGAAVGAALVVFYITRLFLQRTPLGGEGDRSAGAAQSPAVTRSGTAADHVRG